MNLSIQDGRAELWQWDTGVRLVMDEACEAVNLSEDTFGVTVDVTAAEDGKTWVAAVPDEMLQKPGDLICYAVQSTATGTITAAYRSFRVNRRPKPAGYVATPTEARTWQELDDKKIDAPQTAAVGEVLTVEEVDAEGKPKKWKTAPGIRGDKGDTGPAGPKGDTGPEGPKGADGKDGAGMDVTGAKVGQIAKITAVDAAGKPTEWEPVDMPSGGNEDWTLLAEQTTTEIVREISFTLTKSVKHVVSKIWCPATGAKEINRYINVKIGASNLFYYISPNIPDKSMTSQLTVSAGSIGGGYWRLSYYANRGGKTFDNFDGYNQNESVSVGVAKTTYTEANTFAIMVLATDTTQQFPAGTILKVWGY